MSEILIEQSLYISVGSGSFELQARSPGFQDAWLPEAERLCAAFGERPTGVACPHAVFAQPFGRRQVAVVQVSDLGRAHSPGALAFHLMVLDRKAYERAGADPFLIADRLHPDWKARSELPVVTLPTASFPRRTVEELAKALKSPEEGPVLLGGTQALVDGGRVVFERQAPETELIRRLWLLLPTTTRFHLWPASFAFSNALGFDALVVPRANEEQYKYHVAEQQAGDYPQGSYELGLQMAVEAGDQRELDALLSRRSRRETWHMGLLLLGLILVLVIVGKWLTPPSVPPVVKNTPPAMKRIDPRPSKPMEETKPRD